jgi:hypothetical protein
MAHAGRLNGLLEPAWPNEEQMHEEMYVLVDTLLIHGVNQKWFIAFALIDGAEEMVTTQETCVVSWGSLFCVPVVPFWLKSYFINATGSGECSYQLHLHGSWEVWVEPGGLAAGHWCRLLPVYKAGHGKIPGDVRGWPFGAWRLWNLWGLVGHRLVEGWVHPH